MNQKIFIVFKVERVNCPKELAFRRTHIASVVGAYTSVYSASECVNGEYQKCLKAYCESLRNAHPLKLPELYEMYEGDVCFDDETKSMEFIQPGKHTEVFWQIQEVEVEDVYICNK